MENCKLCGKPFEADSYNQFDAYEGLGPRPEVQARIDEARNADRRLLLLVTDDEQLTLEVRDSIVCLKCVYAVMKALFRPAVSAREQFLHRVADSIGIGEVRVL